MKSQQGRMRFLCPTSQVRDPKCEQFTVLPISFASTTIKHVCRVTLQAEAYSLQSGVEAGDRIRGLLGELYGCATPGMSWHEQSRRKVPHLLLTDCRSLHDHLNADVPVTVSDKRLHIELSAMKQSLFEDTGARSTDVFPEGGDRLRWIDTSTMSADALTKSMKPAFVLRVFTNGNIAYAPRSSATSNDCAEVESCTVDRLCIYRVTNPQHICKQHECEPYLAPSFHKSRVCCRGCVLTLIYRDISALTRALESLACRKAGPQVSSYSNNALAVR